MNDELWSRLRGYFDEAMTLPPADRAALVRRVASEDAALGARLGALLEESDSESISLTGAVRDAEAGLEAADRDRRLGQRLGPYRITAHIARGGMGDVFEADRVDGEFEQRVAVKLIGSAALAPDAVARFRAERQILARLNHPNIAQILDGGTTDNGTTYLVMEYVDGLPVDAYCREHRLDLDARLALFRRICAVLEFAHRNLVVHRDIKPSNILVTTDGEPKLLDFGIAKLLEADAPAAPDAPATTRIMTPDYASPEQILGLPISTSCDVYSLGVLLYEMLTGRRPHRLRGMRPAELERAVCETTPARPSTVIEIDAAAGYDRPSAARRRLAGELDNIVLMALRVQPENRYQSVRELSADVRRYLRGEPVVARGRSWGYLTRKFLRRNRVPVAVGAAAVLGLSALAGYHIERISAERDRVRVEAERTTAVSEFLKDIFRIASPDETQGETVTARDILDQGATRLETELSDQPAIRGTLLATVGTVYGYLGLFDSAIENLEQAVAIERRVGDPEALAETLELLARNVYETGEIERSVALLEEALAILDEAGVGDTPLRAQVLYSLGQVHMFLGDYEESDFFHRAALDLWLDPDIGDPGSAANAHDGLGQTLQLTGDIDGAEYQLRQALDKRRTADGRTTMTVLTNAHNLATLLHERGSHAEAETLYLEVYREERVLLGPDHPDLDAATTNLGRLYVETGRYEEAEEFLREGVDHSARTRGERHRYTAYNQNNLASLLARRGKVDEALATWETVLEVYAETLPSDHPFVASAKVAFAAVLIEEDEAVRAESLARDARAICEAALPPDHWLTARARGVLGAALTRQGRLDAAEPELLAAWSNLRETRPGHPMTRQVVASLVEYFRLRGDEARAAEFEATLRTFDDPVSAAAR